MSTSYNHRKKVRKSLFKKHGKELGLNKYQEFVDKLWRERHPFLGTLEEIINKNL